MVTKRIFGFLCVVVLCLQAFASVVPDPPPGGGGGCGNNGFGIKVLGYHVSWLPWTDDPAKIPWSHLTNLSYFALATNPDGTFGSNDPCNGSPCWTDATFLALTTAGHDHCVKVGLSLVGLSHPVGMTYEDGVHAVWGTGAAPAAARATLKAGLLAKLAAANADGVDMDIEFPTPADIPNYVAFIADLTTAVHNWKAGTYVYVAVPEFDYPLLDSGNPGANIYGQLATASDGLAIMGYGYHYDGGPPGPVSPLSIAGTSWPYSPTVPYDLTQTFHWYHDPLPAGRNIPAQKLLMGFPFFGLEWKTTSTAVPGTRTADPVVQRTVKDGFFNGDDCERLFSVANVSGPITRTCDTPYRVSGSTAPYTQLFCEDLDSMEAKFNLATTTQVAGVFFWHENAVPSSYPFWRLIDQHFKTALPTNGAPVVSAAVLPHQPSDPANQVTLGGTATDADADGMILQWTFASGPPCPLGITAANEATLKMTPCPGIYAFTFSAKDGIATGSAGVSLTVPGDSTPPAVSLQTLPACVNGTVTVNATASDSSGYIQRVEFLVDGAVAATDTSSPYSFNWATAGLAIGVHSVQARAFDWSGNVTTSAATSVTVDVDTDGDGVLDACDVCPRDAANDADQDGICAGVGFHAPKTGDKDNCPTVPNSNQWDCNDDGVGDVCSAWCSMKLYSIPAEDGYVPSTGNAVNTGTTLIVGDSAANSPISYRGVISFTVSSPLPPLAQLKTAYLTVVQSTTPPTGTISTLGALRVDALNGPFGGSTTLAPNDYAAAISGTLSSSLPLNGLGAASQLQFQPNELAWINTAFGGRTQLRLRFTNATSANHSADQVQFYTSEYATQTARPSIELLYTAP